MATWEIAGNDRWRRSTDSDNARHLLLHAGNRLVELHGATVHVYTATDVDPGNPLGGATWVATSDRPDLAAADDDTAWQAITADEYTTN